MNVITPLIIVTVTQLIKKDYPIKTEARITLSHNIIISFLVLISLSYFIQSKIFISNDVGYLLHMSNIMLHGGKYVTDILETNPPMIMYLYMPILALAKLTHFSFTTCIHLYVILLSSISFGLSLHFIRQVTNNKNLIYMMAYGIIFTLFFLPIHQFAQREHLLVILTLPYIFSVAVMLHNIKINLFMRLIVGFGAALGFALKPYFLTTLILIESYYLVEKKHILHSIRIETITIASVFFIYLSLIFILQPNYIYILLPLISRVYFPGIEESWQRIISNPMIVYCAISILSYTILHRRIKHSILGNILVLSCLGYLLSLLITRTTWFYHIMPALSFACLLNMFYVGEFSNPETNEKKSSINLNNGFSILASLILLGLPLWNFFLMTKHSIDDAKNGSVNKLVTYINENMPNSSLYSISPNPSFPLVYQTNSTYGSRFPFFWWVRGIQKLSGYPKENKLLSKMVEMDKNFLIESFADDLDKFKTTLIIVNKRENAFFFRDFNFITYFSGNKKFNRAWSNYHYLTTIDYFDLYKRNEKGSG